MKNINTLICGIIIIFSATATATAVQKCEKVNNNYVFTDSVTALYTVTTNKKNRLHESEKKPVLKDDDADLINVQETHCYDVIGMTTTLLFNFDSALLTQVEKSKLTELSMRHNLPDTLVLVGHTDDEGSNDYNDKLGLRRAKVVAQYLMGRGMNNIKLITRSEGKFKPRCMGNDNAAGDCNRRVEIFYEVPQ